MRNLCSGIRIKLNEVFQKFHMQVGIYRLRFTEYSCLPSVMKMIPYATPKLISMDGLDLSSLLNCFLFFFLRSPLIYSSLLYWTSS